MASGSDIYFKIKKQFLVEFLLLLTGTHRLCKYSAFVF